MGLAEDLFDARREAYMLAIRGYSFEMFVEEMSPRARANMEKAIDFLISVLRGEPGKEKWRIQ